MGQADAPADHLSAYVANLSASCVVDFAPHSHEFLREQHAHRRLGFTATEIADFMREAGLLPIEHRELKPAKGDAERLTVSIWVGLDQRMRGDAPPLSQTEMA